MEGLEKIHGWSKKFKEGQEGGGVYRIQTLNQGRIGEGSRME